MELTEEQKVKEARDNKMKDLIRKHFLPDVLAIKDPEEMVDFLLSFRDLNWFDGYDTGYKHGAEDVYEEAANDLEESNKMVLDAFKKKPSLELLTLYAENKRKERL